MPGNPVTIGCNVMLSPGAAGPPDTGIVTAIIQSAATAAGMPLATLTERNGRLHARPVDLGS